MVPAHLSVRTAVQILLKREGDCGISAVFANSPIADLADMQLADLFDQFMQNQTEAEELNRILDLKYDRQKVLQDTTEIEGLKKLESTDGAESHSEQIAAFYVPQMSFFAQFEAKGGVAKIIAVTLASLKLWKSAPLAASWSMWLQELHSFSQIPLFFQLFLKHQKCKELLFKVLAGQPDNELAEDGGKQAYWSQEQKEAVQINYRILGEVFSVSGGLELREKALACGLLPRILERLAAISGEKPRVYEEEASQAEKPSEASTEEVKEAGNTKTTEPEKNTEKKKRKGVGYSSKQGQTFDVSAYLENTKQRNEQIKTLVDICSNFIDSKEWEASEEVAHAIMESALLPLLEQAFRNGSWLDMAKAADVYASYLGKYSLHVDQPSLFSIGESPRKSTEAGEVSGERGSQVQACSA